MTVVATLEKLQETANTNYPSSYDSTKVNLSSLMTQNSGGGANNWVGPKPCLVARPANDALVAANLPATINWTASIDWLFHISSSSSTTHLVSMHVVNRSTGTVSYQGKVTLTYPAATSHTARELRALYYKYTTGTVAVSGTAVTGTGTGWQTATFAVGARIGFGSTDPTQITTWYQISAIGSDSSITLSTSAGTIAGGTAFVIEEIRLAVATTNSISTNGGLQLVKGLSPLVFTSAGTTIPAAVSTDNIQAVYWLKDATTETNTTACGIGVGALTSNTQQYLYVLNGGAVTTAKFYQYNCRAALTLSSGADTAAFQFATGSFTTSSALVSQRACVEATLSHGPGSGVSSIYCLVTGGIGNIYRAPVASITTGSTTFFVDNCTPAQPSAATMGPNPTGNSASYIDYEPIIDRLITMVSPVGLQSMLAVLPYASGSSNIENEVTISDAQIFPTTNTSFGAHPSMFANGFYAAFCASNGFLYFGSDTTTSTIGNTVSFPSGADWNYVSTSKQCIITPSIATSNASKFYNVVVNEIQNFGDNYFGYSSEPFAVYARTGGISDDSGAWTLLDNTGDLSSFAGANAIQFKFVFRTLGRQCIPARITNLAVIWESSADLPGFYEWNNNDTDITTGTVGFTQISTIGDSGLTLEIDYYREDTNANVLTQSSSGTTNGTFQYYNGSTWVNWSGSPPSPDSVGTRNRFVPSAGLPSGVNLYVKIKQTA